jgi:hypothetical protein
MDELKSVSLDEEDTMMIRMSEQGMTVVGGIGSYIRNLGGCLTK